MRFSGLRHDVYVSICLTFLARASGALGTLLFSIALARILGAAEMGRFMLGITIITGVGVLTRLGTDGALLRFAGVAFSERRYFTLKKLYRLARSISIYLGLGAAIIFWVLRDLIVNFFSDGDAFAEVFGFMIWLTPLYSLLFVQAAVFKAMRMPALASLQEGGAVSLLALFGLFLVSLTGITITTDFALILFAVATVVLLLTGRKGVSDALMRNSLTFDVGLKKNDRSVFLASLPDYALMGLLGFVLQWSPFLILGWYSTALELGLFSAAFRVALLINFVLMVCNSVLAPRFAVLHHEGMSLELKDLAQKTTTGMAVFSAPILGAVLIFPDRILALYGGGFEEAKVALIILALAQYVNVSTGAVGFLLNMTGFHKSMKKILMISSFLTFGLSIGLAAFWGADGVATAMALSIFVQNSLAVWVAKRELGIVMLPGANLVKGW